ncbi:MAG: tetratricopeptide repeat protein, partial [Candidatus Obscuribacterales bacterium]|nr:tetratricopeptide repeat protein [Candidatus Obscuribacterales bacterium]
MHRFLVYTLLLSTTLSIYALPATAVPQASKGPRKLQPMKPFEDLSLQEDAIEVYDKAVSAFSRQKYDEAEKLFKKVLSLTPKNADAKYNLGAIAEWHNDLHKALAYYREALALKPGDRDFT